MTALDEARIHLAKAREFLRSADLGLQADLYDPAVSNAVTSGINSKDAICLSLNGRTGKSDRHQDAVGELEAAGAVGRRAKETTKLADHLDRLLSVKSRAQYMADLLGREHAIDAIEHAQALLDGATRIVR